MVDDGNKKKVFSTFSSKNGQRTVVFLSNLITLPQNIILYPEERTVEINEVSNPVLKAQKYTTWKLLEFAVEYIFKSKIDKFNFYRSSNGKWYCNEFFFSISHTDNCALLAVSNHKIGIDAENMKTILAKPKLLSKKLVERILNDSERNRYPELDLFTLGKIWTQKEAIYKFYGGDFFSPKSISTISEKNVGTLLCEISQPILISLKTDITLDFEVYLLSFEKNDDKASILKLGEKCIKKL